VSTCLIIVKLHSCVYRISADRTVAINCHKCLDTLFAERCMSTWHESNVFACCNETIVTCGGNWSSCWSNSCCRCNFTVVVVFPVTVLLFHTRFFRTCVFLPCVAVLEFSVLEFSVLVFSTRTHFSTLYFCFPYLHFPVLAISAPPLQAVFR